jgi:hypothetical protein
LKYEWNMERRAISSRLERRCIRNLPYLQKGEKNRTENYRGITLLNTGYKLHASVLVERMKREIKEKGVVPDSQAGFRVHSSICRVKTQTTQKVRLDLSS